MASRPPPRYVVRTRDDTGPGRWRLWLVLGWVASLLLTGMAVAWMVGSPSVPALSGTGHAKASRAQLEDLRQQVANLQRAKQVSDIATASLRGTLAEREEEISGLRADLGFYSRLVGGDAQRQGLKVQEVSLKPVAGSRGWNLGVSLTQNVKRGGSVVGRVTLAVDGLRADKVVQLEWPALGDDVQKDGVPFRFKYFQQLQLTFVLPADFHPTRLRIHVQADGGAPVDRTVAWNDALAGKLKPAPAS